MFIKGKNLLVIGLGKTGVSVIRQVREIAGSIIAVDDNPGLDTGIPQDEKLRIFTGSRARDKRLLENVHLVIASPGIAGHHPVISWAGKMNIPVWSELELGWSMLDSQERKNTVAVTGTNGKTTAVNLMGKILDGHKMDACVCGNVGDPLINTVDKKNLFRVIEVSSFQLERVISFAPHIGILLNISSDHIDRHSSMEEYTRLKFRLFLKQDSSDFCILNADDSIVSAMASGLAFKPRVIKYGIKQKKGLDLFLEKNNIICSIGSIRGKIDIGSMRLKGVHNTSNIMACVAAAKLLGVGDRVIEKAVTEFKPLAHRLEYTGTYRGIAFYNDSKSTNPQATIAALGNFKKPLTLVLGGKDKGMELGGLFRVLEEKVSNLILIGQSREKIQDALNSRGHSFKINSCDTLEEAVKKGFDVTPGEGTLLFSPAFASMDMFKDYKDRGNQFKSLVRMKGYGH